MQIAMRTYLVAVMTVALLLMLNRELGFALLTLALISEITNYRKALRCASCF